MVSSKIEKGDRSLYSPSTPGNAHLMMLWLTQSSHSLSPNLSVAERHAQLKLGSGGTKIIDGGHQGHSRDCEV